MSPTMLFLGALLFSSDGSGAFFGNSTEDEIYIGGSYTPVVPAPATPPALQTPPASVGPVVWRPAPDVPDIVRNPQDSYCEWVVELAECIPDGTYANPNPADPAAQVDVVGIVSAQVERDIATMQVEAARINWQPRSDEVLVNMDTIVYTDAQTQYLNTFILGRAVTVEVTPVWYEWNYGDGSRPFGTIDPGAPYPDYTVFHAYAEPGEYVISLRTTWSARFQIHGLTGWLPVNGQPITTDSVGPISAVTKTNRLIYQD